MRGRRCLSAGHTSGACRPAIVDCPCDETVDTAPRNPSRHIPPRTAGALMELSNIAAETVAAGSAVVVRHRRCPSTGDKRHERQLELGGGSRRSQHRLPSPSPRLAAPFPHPLPTFSFPARCSGRGVGTMLIVSLPESFDHCYASLLRRRTVPTRRRSTSTIGAPITSFSIHYTRNLYIPFRVAISPSEAVIYLRTTIICFFVSSSFFMSHFESLPLLDAMVFPV